MTVRVGIDYTAAAWQGAGIGRYTRELVRAILALDTRRVYTLFYAAGGIDRASPYLAELQRLCVEHRHVRAVPIPLSPRRLTQIWHRLRIPLPVELFTGRLDLIHAPDFVLPPTLARHRIVTIHDLSFRIHPECALPSVADYLNRAVPRALQHANGVLADSEATRRDLAAFMGNIRAQVIYPGVGPQFRPLPPEQIETERRKTGLPERFVLFVGTLEPRKNLARLVQAFAALNEQRQEPPVHLLIAGRRGWMYEDVFAAIERFQVGQWVRTLDFVNDKDLPTLYNLACALAYPSIYEGFGLPVLEAMACGTPVLTADNSSLPEVAGDAAVLVQAESINSITAGLARIIYDEALRAHLRVAGLERARLFTWERAAQQVLDYYKEIESDHGSAA